MNEVTVAIIVAVVTAVGTVWVQLAANKGNTQTANIEAYPDIASELHAALDQSRKLNADLIEETQELSRAREAIQQLTTEVTRLDGDASAGVDFLKHEAKIK